MDFLSEYGIVINSYEIEKENDGSEKANPILTHVFWGKTIKQAVGYAKSHLISDFFFSSNFIGQMEWNDSTLELAYNGKIISIKPISQFSFEDSLEEIKKEVERILPLQESYGIPDIINSISRK